MTTNFPPQLGPRGQSGPIEKMLRQIAFGRQEEKYAGIGVDDLFRVGTVDLGECSFVTSAVAPSKMVLAPVRNLLAPMDSAFFAHIPGIAPSAMADADTGIALYEFTSDGTQRIRLSLIRGTEIWETKEDVSAGASPTVFKAPRIIARMEPRRRYMLGTVSSLALMKDALFRTQTQGGGAFVTTADVTRAAGFPRELAGKAGGGGDLAISSNVPFAQVVPKNSMLGLFIT